MAGTTFTQEPHGRDCRLPLATVPSPGRLDSAELPRIGLVRRTGFELRGG